jgi:hypothetical protein
MTTKDMDLECYGINLETADKENYQRMVSIPTELIEKALELTGKTMEDMEEISEETDKYNEHSIRVFSYPKLYAYLLSPEFIEKYEKHTKQDMHYIDTKKDLYRLF